MGANSGPIPIVIVIVIVIGWGMAFFIVSAWSYAVVWYVFLPEIGLK